jgi:hypothetical protein
MAAVWHVGPVPGEPEQLGLTQAEGLPGGRRALPSSPGPGRTCHAAIAFRSCSSRSRSWGVALPQMPVAILPQVSAPDWA